MRKILYIAALLLVSVVAKAQPYGSVVEAKDSTLAGNYFEFKDAERKLDEVTYHEFSDDSISWHKTQTLSDVWVRFSNDNQNTWFTLPIQAIIDIDLSGIRDTLQQNTNHRLNDQDTVIGNEYQVLYSNGSPGNIGIDNGNSININVNDGDTSLTNEIQVLSISNDTIYLSDGGFAVVPSSTPSYSLDSPYLPYWNGTTFVNSPFFVVGEGISLSRNTTGWALSVENNYNTGGGSYGLYINTIGSSGSNIGLNVDGSFLVYGNGMVRMVGYDSSTQFTGTVNYYLAVDANGNIIVASGTSGSGDDWGSQYALTSGFIDGSGVTGDPIVLSATGTPSSSTFLRGDGTWAVPPSGSSVWTQSTYGPYTTENVGIGGAPLQYVPFRIVTSQSGYQVITDNPSTNGGGFLIDASDNDGDQYLLNVRNAGTARFQVQSDGSIYLPGLISNSTGYDVQFDPVTKKLYYYPDGTGGSSDGYIGNVSLSGSNLVVTGYGSAFNGSVDLSGLGGGSGTVTSVGLSSSDFDVTGSPITTSGTFTVNLGNNSISNQTALTSGLLSTDELLINDGGALKRMDISVIEDYMQNNLDFETTLFSGASLYRTTTDDADFPILFDSENYDTDAYHSTISNTSRITIPEDGYYNVTIIGSTLLTGGGINTLYTITLRKNGLSFRSYPMYVELVSGYRNNISISEDFYLSSGEYLEIGIGTLHEVQVGDDGLKFQIKKL